MRREGRNFLGDGHTEGTLPEQRHRCSLGGLPGEDKQGVGAEGGGDAWADQDLRGHDGLWA